MTSAISYCGLVCKTCPIHIATREENEEKQLQMRADVARMCREHYHKNYEAKDIIDCDGCRAGGRLFFYCKDCPIRNCATEKKVETCAHCDQYACAQLEAFFANDPSARTRLDEIRRQLGTP